MWDTLFVLNIIYIPVLLGFVKKKTKKKHVIFTCVFKVEHLNADMSLSMSEKSVTAEKEDDKNGNFT